MKTIALGMIGAAVFAASVDAQVRHVSGSSPSPLSAATVVDKIVYVSGQIGVGTDGTLAPDFAGQTRQTMENIKAVLATEKLEMRDIFKCTVMLSDMANFAAFNDIYSSYFARGTYPARSAFAASALVRGALVEVECMARIRD